MNKNFDRVYFKKRILELGYKTEKDFLEQTLTPKTTLTHIKEGKCDLSSAMRLCVNLKCELNDLFVSTSTKALSSFKTIAIVAPESNTGISSFCVNLSLLLSKRKYKTMVIEYGGSSSIDFLHNLNKKNTVEIQGKFSLNDYTLFKHNDYLTSCYIEDANNFTKLDNIGIDLKLLTNKIDAYSNIERQNMFDQMNKGKYCNFFELLNDVRESQIIENMSLMSSEEIRKLLEYFSSEYNIEYFILNCRGITPISILSTSKPHFARSENFIKISDVVIAGYCTFKTNSENFHKLIELMNNQNIKVYILEFLRLRDAFFKLDKLKLNEYKKLRKQFNNSIYNRFNNFKNINFLPFSVDYIEGYTEFYSSNKNIYSIFSINEKSKIQKYKSIVRNIFEEIDTFLRDSK